MSTVATTSTTVPVGTWRLDPKTSEVGFASRGMFGLARVRGTFATSDGTLDVDSAGARGQLNVHAASLDTANARRDKHLRSADFFDVENSPTVTFELTGIEPAADGTTEMSGTLRIRDNQLPLNAPVVVTQIDADHVRLDTKLSVDRAGAGVGWSKLGMIQGLAHLNASVTLTRV